MSNPLLRTDSLFSQEVMSMYSEIKKCRICGNTDLIRVIDLGKQFLTGVFPGNKEKALTSGPLELVKCQDDPDNKCCGLVQLGHSYNFDELYGENYGYRSGLNKSMVTHLQGKVKKIEGVVGLSDGDLVIDIGSNDATLLRAYSHNGLNLTGIDPTGKKFKKYYTDNIHLLPEFFSAKAVKNKFGNKKAKVITSISMFYDLESPLDFMRQIKEILCDDGIWVFEQSYLPNMLKANGYDTICHEHLEYYRLKQIKWMTDKLGLKIIDVEFNNINGGSFSITAAKAQAPYKENKLLVENILRDEEAMELAGLNPYRRFLENIYKSRDELVAFMDKAKKENKKILGYGASTKGNVILQFCNLTEKDISFIAEVNEDKFGCYTPGTLIPIISEKEAKAMKPDYFMVLPWHFKDNIISREKKYLDAGGRLMFPLPNIAVI